MTEYRKGDLYYVQEGNEHAKVAACQTSLQMRLWHDRMRHLNANDLNKVMLKCGIKGIKTDKKSRLPNYDICFKGKMTATSFPPGNVPCAEVLKIIHSDVVGR